MFKALEAALEQYRLVMAERELLKRTLHGVIKVLTEILSLVNPAAFSRANRIRTYVTHMAAGLLHPEVWQHELAAMLSQIGCMVPPDLHEKVATGETLSPEEEEVVSAHALVAQHLLENVPRLEAVGKMVGGQASTAPTATQQNSGIESQMLRAANEFDQLVRGGSSRAEAILTMRYNRSRYDLKLLDALENAPLDNSGYDSRVVTVEPTGHADNH